VSFAEDVARFGSTRRCREVFDGTVVVRSRDTGRFHETYVTGMVKYRGRARLATVIG
jgi:hypothetical protein